MSERSIKVVSKSSSSQGAGMSLQKPRKRGFRFSDTQKRVSRIPQGERSINRDGPSLDIIRPSWKGGDPTTVRILPNFNPEEPNGPLDQTRLTTDSRDFSDWCRAVPAARYIGIDDKYTFVTHDRMREFSSDYKPRRDNPYHTLFYAVSDAVKSGEAIIGGKNVMTSAWNPLVLDGPRKAFNAPTVNYYMQCLVYSHQDEVFVDGDEPPKGARPGDLPQVLQMTKTAGDSLCNKLNLLNDAYKGDTDITNQHEMYLYGDLVDLEVGAFVTFFNPDHHTGVMDMIDGEYQDSNSGRQFKGWETGVNESFVHYSRRKAHEVGPNLTAYEEEIRKNILWWDDVIEIPEHEQICTWLAQAFSPEPDLLRFGWADHPEFFTDEVNGILNSRTQTAGVFIEPTPEPVAEAPAPVTETVTESVAVADSVDTSFDDDDDDYEEEVVHVDGDDDDLTEEDSKKIEEAMKAAEERAAKRTTRKVPRKRG